MYIVSLKAGGPLSGPHLREEYQHGRAYTYPEEDAPYVESVLRGEARLAVKHIPPPPSGVPAKEGADQEGEAGSGKSNSTASGNDEPTGESKANSGDSSEGQSSEDDGSKARKRGGAK
ncbi:MAG: hypothetical protein ACO1RX_20135 [Candidatus Sericytochromatia bacterium]